MSLSVGYFSASIATQTYSETFTSRASVLSLEAIRAQSRYEHLKRETQVH